MNLEKYQEFKNTNTIQKTTDYLLNQHYISLFPITFDHTLINNSINALPTILSFSFTIQLFLDFEHLFRIHFTYSRKSGYESIIEPQLTIYSDTLYEYGNEEIYLPDVNIIKSCWTYTDFLQLIKEEIHSYFQNLSFSNLSDYEINTSFKKEIEFLHSLYLDPSKNTFINDENENDSYLDSYEFKKINYLFSRFNNNQKYEDILSNKINGLLKN